MYSIPVPRVYFRLLLGGEQRSLNLICSRSHSSAVHVYSYSAFFSFCSLRAAAASTATQRRPLRRRGMCTFPLRSNGLLTDTRPDFNLIISPLNTIAIPVSLTVRSCHPLLYSLLLQSFFDLRCTTHNRDNYLNLVQFIQLLSLRTTLERSL